MRALILLLLAGCSSQAEQTLVTPPPPDRMAVLSEMVLSDHEVIRVIHVPGKRPSMAQECIVYSNEVSHSSNMTCE